MSKNVTRKEMETTLVTLGGFIEDRIKAAMTPLDDKIKSLQAHVEALEAQLQKSIVVPLRKSGT